MSGPDDINAVVVALRVIANPKTFRLSTNESIALAECLVGLCLQLDVTEDAIAANPPMNARLAAAIACFIKAEDDLQTSRLPDGYFPQPKWAARGVAFNTLKTTFETEFPQ